MNRRLLCGVAAIGLMALAGCGGGGEPTAAPTDSPAGSLATDAAASAPMLKAWTRKDLTPFGGAVEAGDRALLFTTRNGHIYATALDAKTGDTVWSRETDPSGTTTGVSFVPMVFGSDDHPRTLVMRPSDEVPGLVRIDVVDARTGEVLGSGRSNENVTEAPQSCEQSKTTSTQDACYVTWDDAQRRKVDMWVSGTSPSPQPQPVQVATPWPMGRELGSLGVSENGERDGHEEFGRIVDGRVLWSHSTTQVYGPTATSDVGWSFTASPDDSVIWGTIGTRSARADETDLSPMRTAGFDAKTGELKWTAPHTTPYCRPWVNDDNGAADAVRCAVAGTLHFGPHDSITGEGVKVTLQGFDVSTGRTTWSVPLGSNTGLLTARVVPRAGPTQVVVHALDGPTIVDLASGETTAVSDGDTYACLEQTIVHYYRGREADGSGTAHAGGDLTTLCDANGKPVAGDFSSALARSVGTEVGDTVVVSGKKMVTGWKASSGT